MVQSLARLAGPNEQEQSRVSTTTAAFDAPHSPCRFVLHDATAKIFVLTHLVALIEQSDERRLADLLHGGLSPAAIEQLRGLSLADACRLVGGPCGLSIHIDPRQIQHQLSRLAHAKLDREMYEYFIRNGASPSLLAQLFHITKSDVRRMRKVLAPAVAVGGRPRSPEEPDRGRIEAAWAQLCQDELSERQRFFRLHQDFSQFQIASLETVVRPSDSFDSPPPRHGTVPVARAQPAPSTAVAAHTSVNGRAHAGAA
jgi:Protein of unknown function (DUF2857)